MSIIVKWHWDFDDGDTSSEKNPIHVFLMTGVYEVVLIREDLYGNQFTSKFKIRVYDYDYTGNNPNASITDKCYRLPVKPGDGYGVSDFRDSENPGEDWIWPPARKGAAICFDQNQREIALVINSKTREVFQINNPDIWQDRVGIDYQDGKPIIAEVHQKSHKAANGEHIAIVHTETHAFFEAFRKDLAGESGYTSRGLPTGFRVDLQMHKNNEEILEKKTLNVPLDGDIVFQEKLEAKKLQLRAKIYRAPWLLTEFLNDFDTIDKAGQPSLRQMTETGYQLDISSMPLLHISRSYFPLLNRATGKNATGSYTLVVGPDGREYSALYLETGQSISDTLTEDMDGDFTLMCWFKGSDGTLWEVGT